ncbi:MAG: glycosyltransferase [Candidatus Eisenbacteria bacterium]|nr:glycosyltransferase [Candidatus Latescibacterota bacterium]MBD3303266.1 glycosyltransferase [Candidatus Eisenbacteria bacterium]
MRICDIVQAHTASSGGIRTYLDAKIGYLKKRTDWEHVLIVPGKSDRVRRNGRTAVYEVAAPPVPFCAPYRMMVRQDKIAAILARERPQVIELGSPYFLPGAARRHLRNHRCGVVGFYHTDVPDAYVRPFTGRVLGRRAGDLAGELASRWMRGIYRSFDATVVPSLAVWKKLRTLGIAPVFYLNLGVDMETFHPSRRSEELRRSLGVAEGGRLLVYAGRFDLEKRVGLLVESFEKLSASLGATLLLVGDGPLRDRLEEVAERNPRVVVRSYTRSREELSGLLASADLYVTAGPSETFGLSVLEAQAAGLPVVGVAAGALLERVTPENGILGPVDDSSAMAANIERVIANGLAKRSAAARETVEREYSWAATFHRMFDLYETITRAKLGTAGAVQAHRRRPGPIRTWGRLAARSRPVPVHFAREGR